MPSGNGKAPPAAEPLPAAAARRLAALLDRVAPPALALAVSGGPDSLALLALAERWAAPRGVPLAVLTVDHGLRPAAAAEAARVDALARSRGHRSVILRWTENKPERGIAAAARTARYALMAAWCRAQGIGHLATAHTRDDQAETLIMRLHRGSGLDGLAAIAPVTERDGIIVLRPLLSVPKAALQAIVRAEGWTAVDDPSNRDQARLRPRVRALIDALGLDSERLAETAARLDRDRAVIDGLVEALAAAAIRYDGLGGASIALAPLMAAPAPVAERLFGRLLAGLAGTDYPPRHGRIEALLGRLRRGGPLVATLGGCRVALRRDGTAIDCTREAAAVGPSLVLDGGASGVWDNRFCVRAGALPVEIRALGALKPAGLPDMPRWRRAALPAVFRGSTLVSVPLLGVGDPAVADVSWITPRLWSNVMPQPVVYQPQRLI